MKNQFLILMVLACLFAGSCFAAESIKGDISSVIVYRGQALVTRSIEVKLPKGTTELIVENLPEKVVPGSLYAEAEDGITILSVRYRERAVREDTRQEVKEIDRQIKELTKQIEHDLRDHQNADKRFKKYEELWKLNVDGASVNLKNGVLEFEPIRQLAEFLEAKYIEIHKEKVMIEEKRAQMNEELELLQRKRNKLAEGYSRTQRQAVVFLSKADNKPVRLELNYLVNGADWSPQYNLRADLDKSNALIEYNAVLHQSSGESWENTTIALSTAQPSLVASSPLLDPMEITLVEFTKHYGFRGPMLGKQVNVDEMAQQAPAAQYDYIDRSEQFGALIKSRRLRSKQGRLAQSDLNTIAVSNQMLEFEADKDTLKKMKTQIAMIKRVEGVSVMYKVPGNLTLPSRSDQQILNIAAIRAKADFAFVATPLLTDYVYLQGEILNESDTILLPGPASMYRNGEFVGKDQMNLVTIGQKFIAGFGIDSQIQVEREFEDKKIETLWGNRIDDHQYRIEINNYKKQPVSLRLLERLPYTANPNIEIALKKSSHELSKDSEYLRTLKEKGILRWDLNLKPTSHGEKATVITYGFTMKYDNDMRIQAAKNQ